MPHHTGSLNSAVETRAMIAVYDPSTEEQIGEIADGGAAAIDEAVGRARASFEAGLWTSKTPSERAKILWRAADLIESRAEEIGDIDSRNVGMAPYHARNLVYAGAELFRYFSGWCRRRYHAVERSGAECHDQAGPGSDCRL